MLRAAHPHPAQACLAFANPPPAETKFATRLHAAQLPSLEGEAKATFNLIIFVVKSVHVNDVYIKADCCLHPNFKFTNIDI